MRTCRHRRFLAALGTPRRNMYASGTDTRRSTSRGQSLTGSLVERPLASGSGCAWRGLACSDASVTNARRNLRLTGSRCQWNARMRLSSGTEMGTTGTRRSPVTGGSAALAELAVGSRWLSPSTARSCNAARPAAIKTCSQRRTVRRQHPKAWARAGTHQPRADQRTNCARRASRGLPTACQWRNSRCWAGVSEDIRSIGHLPAEPVAAGFPPLTSATAVGVLEPIRITVVDYVT